jgi:hypothetical protein
MADNVGMSVTKEEFRNEILKRQRQKQKAEERAAEIKMAKMDAEKERKKKVSKASDTKAVKTALIGAVYDNLKGCEKIKLESGEIGIKLNNQYFTIKVTAKKDPIAGLE